METNQSKLSIIVAGCFSLIICFALIYLVMLILTLGSSVISGLLVSLMLLKVGVIGFVLAVLLILLKGKIKKSIILIFAVMINVVSELAQAIVRSSGKSNKVGETIIVRHHEVNDTLIGVGDVVLIVIVTSVLLAMFFGLLKKGKRSL